MIIVSQNKNVILNFQKTEAINIVKDLNGITGYSIKAEAIITKVNLATYKTEERAKEVLQEIVAKYLEYVKTGGRFDYKALNNTTEHYFSLPKVYEMPKE